TQTIMAVNARLFRSRLTISGPNAGGVRVELMGGLVEQNETGHLKDFQRHVAPNQEAKDGVTYQWKKREGNPFEFALNFGDTSKAEAASFDELLAERRKQSEAAYAAVPKFDFHDPKLNLFHRIMWERLRGLAENAAGGMPFAYFMGTSAPWGIDGLWLWDAAF